MSKQTQQAHEVIVEEMKLTINRMSMALSRIDDGRRGDEEAACELIRAKSSFCTLLQVLGKLATPENQQWIIEKLNRLVDVDHRSFNSLLAEVRRTIEEICTAK